MPRRDYTPLNALLKDLEVDRVDFVGAGANGESDIVLFKSHRGTRYVPKTNGGTMPAIKKTDAELAAEAQDAAIKKAVDEAVTAAVAKTLEDLATLAEADDTTTTTPTEPAPEDKQLDPAVAKAVADAVAVEKKAREQVEKDLAELRKERAEEIVLAKAAKLPAIGSVEDVAKVLKSVAAGDPNAAEQVETMFKALNERLEKSGLLTELGVKHGGDTSGDPKAQLLAKAAAFQEADPSLSPSDAYTKAVAEMPGVYDEFRKGFKG